MAHLCSEEGGSCFAVGPVFIKYPSGWGPQDPAESMPKEASVWNLLPACDARMLASPLFDSTDFLPDVSQSQTGAIGR